MKLLVSDFDRTLFDRNYINNIEAVNNFVDEGNMFVIATGRNFPHLLRGIGSNIIKYSYLICNDGSIIYDSNLNCIFRLNIDIDTAINVISFITHEIGNSISDWYVDTSEDYIKNFNHGVNAILLRVKNLDKAKVLLINILDKFKNIDGYIGDNHINLRHKNTSKSIAIKYLIDIEKIKKDNVYTIGDNVNDIEMIRDYNGYCMINNTLGVESICINFVNNVEELVNKIK